MLEKNATKGRGIMNLRRELCNTSGKHSFLDGDIHSRLQTVGK